MIRPPYLRRSFLNEAPPRRALLEAKQQQQGRYITDLRKVMGAQALGERWSKFADQQLDQALIEAWQTCKHAKAYAPDTPEPVTGLFILGLGKLGGHDLNYSSDVDLVAFYDATTLPVPETAGRTYVCAEVLRTLNRLIDGHTSGAYAWRMDWRLRPDPSVTDLAMSAEAGLEYFQFHAAPWRRLAMMKARVVAGDRAAGEAFLARLHGFIWRRTLDFSMIEEIAHLKNRIHLEHPDLADSRRISHDLKAQDGFHLKLGRGGIRDIEFIANAQQLLWGGRLASLQTTHTLSALAALGEAGLQENTPALAQAYAYLRTLENTVQAYADQHTHILPSQGEPLEWVEQTLATTRQEIHARLADYRALVARAFDNLFRDAAPAPAFVPLIHLPAQPFGLSEREATALNPVLHRLDQSLPDAEAARVFADWFAGLRNAPAHLRALQQAPHVADLAFTSIRRSPAVAHLIRQSPHALDSLFARSDLVDKPSVAAHLTRAERMLQASPRFEDKLAALRTWINESLYLTYLSLIASKTPLAQAPALLTHLAEGALDLCAQVAAEAMGLSRLPFTILAMGRMGLGAMTPGSDLDLIFVLDDEADFELGNRAVAKFLSVMNARLKEGRVYEIDTRLRPSGASGPPTLSFRSFADHQLNRAKTWEHLALTFMRPLRGTYHGEQSQIAAIASLQQQVLRQERDEVQWRGDCQVMLGRLLNQRIGKADLPDAEVKLANGGLMELEYILAAKTLLDPTIERLGGAASALGLSSTWTFQREALLLQRLYGASWPELHPAQWQAFGLSQASVLSARLNLLGEQTAFVDAKSYDEGPVTWTQSGSP